MPHKNPSVTTIVFVATALTLAVAALPVHADAQHLNLGKAALALSGYDVVAYYAEGGGNPAKGSEEFTTTHDGAMYRFASQANLEKFEADPARFVPEYGGWCAYAMAQNEKVEVDPKSFLVTDGQLTLFYKGFLNDTRKKWLKDSANLKSQADGHWRALVAGP